ncbi:MAG: hypothetical protein HFI67_03345 [Lachnospiraceae bacterium]|jgi:hypothetical protein|nr:hypothetical protein [Lachnospiraceae bacterium]
MGRFRDKLTRFMYGRYGVDQLNRFLMGIVMVSLVISLFVRYRFFYWVTVLGIGVSYFRMFSKNIRSRSRENQKYLQATARIRGSFARLKSRSQDKSHCYFKCPSCRQTVRVPRGKGKISITCPKCRREFIKKT